MKRAKNQKMPIKIGDNVQIISGFYKSKMGEVTKIDKKTGKLIIAGINLKFKHMKPNNESEVGEIKQLEASIHHSNVKLNTN